MNKVEREKVLDFATEANVLVFHLENLLEEYKCNDKLTGNQLVKIEHKIWRLRNCERELKKVLGIEVEE